jgi:membrane protein
MSRDARPEPALPNWMPGWLSSFMRLPFPRALWLLYAGISQTDVFGLAAEMAYRFLFALFPFLIFLAAFVGFIGARVGSADLFERVMRLLAFLFPGAVQQVLEEWVRGVLATQSTGLLTLGAAGALWGAAGGVGTLVKGLNRSYGVAETRPFWHRQGLALLTTLVFALLMLGGVAAFTIGELLIGWAVESLHIDAGIWFWWHLIRGPGITLVLGLVFAVIYAALPNRHLGLEHTWPGALFATLAWLGLTSGFGLYVTHLGSFDRTFGSLGAAVVLMFWMYAVGAILLIGGQINALMSGHARPVTT